MAVHSNSNALPSGKAQVPAYPEFLNPSDMPERYALICDSDCMLPEIASGTKLVFNSAQPCKPGDMVALFFRPEDVEPGTHQVRVKRLVVGLAPWTVWGKPSRGDVQPIIIVEMLNPHR